MKELGIPAAAGMLIVVVTMSVTDSFAADRPVRRSPAIDSLYSTLVESMTEISESRKRALDLMEVLAEERIIDSVIPRGAYDGHQHPRPRSVQ